MKHRQHREERHSRYNDINIDTERGTVFHKKKQQSFICIQASCTVLPPTLRLCVEQKSRTSMELIGGKPLLCLFIVRHVCDTTRRPSECLSSLQQVGFPCFFNHTICFYYTFTIWIAYMKNKLLFYLKTIGILHRSTDQTQGQSKSKCQRFKIRWHMDVAGNIFNDNNVIVGQIVDTQPDILSSSIQSKNSNCKTVN